MEVKIVYVQPDVDYVRGRYYVDYVIKFEKDGLKVISENYFHLLVALERIKALQKDIGKVMT